MAFFQEFRPAREPFIRAPASVLVLIGLLVAAHIGRTLAPPAVSDGLLNGYALVAVIYSPQALHALGAGSPSWYALLAPLVGHMFLHAGALHLTINCLWLLVFGSVVARRLGPLGFYLLFLLCGLGGAVVFIAVEWGQVVGAIGASGAISGLMGAAIRMIRLQEPWLNGADVRLAPLSSRPVLSFSAIWLLLNLAMGLTGFVPGGTLEPIAWQDHLGGYLAGLILAGPFDRLFGLARRAG